MQVLYNTSQVQTVVVRTQSACMLTEPEPEVETAELMIQTEAEEPTPVATVDTQTISLKLIDSIVQTERKPLSHIHIQTDKAKMSDSCVQTDDVSTTLFPLFQMRNTAIYIFEVNFPQPFPLLVSHTCCRLDFRRFLECGLRSFR